MTSAGPQTGRPGSARVPRACRSSPACPSRRDAGAPRRAARKRVERRRSLGGHSRFFEWVMKEGGVADGGRRFFIPQELDCTSAAQNQRAARSLPRNRSAGLEPASCAHTPSAGWKPRAPVHGHHARPHVRECSPVGLASLVRCSVLTRFRNQTAGKRNKRGQ